MIESCPTTDVLLWHALGLSEGPTADAVASHARRCDSCRVATEHLRETVLDLRDWSSPKTAAPPGCLDDVAIAAFIDAALTPSEHAGAVSHLAACSSCRVQVATVAHVLRTAPVTEALGALGEGVTARSLSTSRWSRHRRVIAGAIGGLAAAGIALFIARPNAVHQPSSDDAATVHRERPITSTSAPRLIDPISAGSSSDTLRWTSVPHADRYRAVIFDADGNVAHRVETNDTLLVLPAALRSPRQRLYLWKVAARTGWDRWVESELSELPLGSPPRRE